MSQQEKIHVSRVPSLVCHVTPIVGKKDSAPPSLFFWQAASRSPDCPPNIRSRSTWNDLCNTYFIPSLPRSSTVEQFFHILHPQSDQMWSNHDATTSSCLPSFNLSGRLDDRSSWQSFSHSELPRTAYHRKYVLWQRRFDVRCDSRALVETKC